ncbi:septal ring lytic transglycosylase RlpA family protein [Hyphomicrobium sp.]|uniref:septal ring lytic transglycosylase RlpA family protein n=1 Tax=Hyphomicrobium sp. TaxID=82 RepID=UPI002C44142E|nr:septal ring lytic transglycosylase RlpA family protein [Hyphomicrobium sp.]HRN88453.1 septal ring lytic transglycosylase RlpA family protein [Hyphomicrobium sp.]HRQ26604.1 septal ring lytic transglycosylase RlpA family protein [Hyphomicrobium sp.]
MAFSLAPAFGGAMLTAGVLTAGLGVSQVEAKTPGKTYCYNRVCHRVKTLAETKALVGSEETLHTSFYDDCRKDRLNPCGLTSSGEVFRANTPDNAASPIYPNGTVLLIWSPATKKSAVVRVNNAGPYWRNRKLDVSKATAQKLGFAGRGVAHLKVRVIGAPTRAEATYQKRRRYDPVPGYIGEFASLDDAHIGAAQTYAVAALSAPKGAETTTTVAALPAQPGDAEALVAEQEAPVVTVAAADADAVEAVVKTPGTEVAVVDEASEVKAIQVATLIQATDVSEPEPQRQPNSAKNMTGEPVRVRSRVEREQPRNSRTYRNKQRQQTASRQKQRQSTPAPRLVSGPTPAPRLVSGPTPITRDATNDISVFSRHMHSGAARLAAGDVMRRNY